MHRLLSALGRRIAAGCPPRVAVAALLLACSACGTAESVAPGEVSLNENAIRVFEGAFVSLVHPTEGTLRIEIDDQEQARAIFLDDFVSDNGPNLVVGLTTTSAAEMTNANAWPAGTVALGALQGVTGAQSYTIDAGTDVDAFMSVVVWCEEFSVAFGAASYADVENP